MSLREIRQKIRVLDEVKGSLVSRGGCACHGKRTRSSVPKHLWRYLGFFFDCKLLFIEHAKMYATESFSAVMAMASLGNSNHRLCPKHKHLLYQSCILPIATYGIRLWFFKGTRYKGTLKDLTRMQRCAAICILGAFKTSPTGAVETLAGLTPIHLHIRKLVQRSYS